MSDESKARSHAAHSVHAEPLCVGIMSKFDQGMKVFLNKSVAVGPRQPVPWQSTSRRNLTSSKGGVVNLRASGSFPPVGASERQDERMAMTRSTAALRLVEPAVDTRDHPLFIDPVDSVEVPSIDQIERRRRFRAVRAGLVAADASAIGLGLVLATVLADESWTGFTGAIGLVAVAATWLVAFGVRRLYRARYVESPLEEAKRVITAGISVIIAVLATSYVADVAAPARDWTLLALGLVTALVLSERLVARTIFRRLRSDGRLRRRIVIVGTDAAALALCDSLTRDPVLGYDVVGLIGASQENPEFPVLADVDHAATAIVAHGAVGAIVSTSSLTGAEVNQVVRQLNDANLHVALSTSMADISLARLRPQGIDGNVMLYVEPTIRSGWRAGAKRTFDIVIAIVGLVVAFPVMVIAALAVRMSSPGPVLFRQTRVGRDGEPFAMLKFRTMVADAEEQKQLLLAHNEADGPLFKMTDDPRITRVGRFLRKWSLDELPQLWNVLIGEMSMVGPRPALPEEVEGWDLDLRRRLTVPPGLTGEWQVSGRSDASFAKYRRLDLYYVDNWTLGHDVRVCLKTAWAVLRADGAR